MTETLYDGVMVPIFWGLVIGCGPTLVIIGAIVLWDKLGRYHVS